MFATKEYLESAFAMFSYEKTLLGYTRKLVDTNYDNMVRLLLFREDIDKREKVCMLASWDLAVSLASFNYPDASLKEAETALEALKGKEIPKQYDGILAKAMQSLRYHIVLSYKDFM